MKCRSDFEKGGNASKRSQIVIHQHFQVIVQISQLKSVKHEVKKIAFFIYNEMPKSVTVKPLSLLHLEREREAMEKRQERKYRNYRSHYECNQINFLKLKSVDSTVRCLLLFKACILHKAAADCSTELKV